MCKRLAVCHMTVVTSGRFLISIRNPNNRHFSHTVPHRHTQGVRPQGRRGFCCAPARCVCPGHVWACTDAVWLDCAARIASRARVVDVFLRVCIPQPVKVCARREEGGFAVRPHAAFVRDMCGHVLTPFGWTAQLESHRALAMAVSSGLLFEGRLAPPGTDAVDIPTYSMECARFAIRICLVSMLRLARDISLQSAPSRRDVRPRRVWTVARRSVHVR